ncbi:DUF4159 domain-containing protein [Pseudoruegeria sp. SK021]|uniref:DUF4159 domain-containing protein n=1 Tax=Pseudoruegeria sp. SK021 TaxID=1933035 RepID=UPI000A25FB39|nr:DUF4159 domain-containing protein [Pseudoruegeria sp. SK021]OSP56566.1 LytTR family transcriptional regulator [Pseudoruegeria sp. SK021]
MLALGPLAFTVPWLLLGLGALPVLWLLLRAVPPAPIRRRFPGVALLLGLRDDDSQSDKTPWWLLLIRVLAVAAVILGFAGPVLNPQTREPGTGPLLVLIDGTWADARDWSPRIERVGTLLDEAGRANRPVAVVVTTDVPAGALSFQTADVWQTLLASLQPVAWVPEDGDLMRWADSREGRFDTVWLSDGVAREAKGPVLAALQNRGAVRIIESGRPLYGLRPARYAEGEIDVTVIRDRPGIASTVTVAALGPDPAGITRALAQADVTFDADATEAQLRLALPAELRNRVARFEIVGQRSAAAVSLTDDALKRREVALIAGNDQREGLELLSPLHYLQQALEPTADLIDGDIAQVLLANPDAIVLADVARITDAETAAMITWLEAGGLLVRFAGPRLAASDISRDIEDPLMPVRLRAGGRSLGGAMSWGEPKTLRPFTEGSPFFGLTLPDDVTVTSQVLAQPDPTLAEREIAALSDGTPLVSSKQVGAGRVVLFHVTANADWSTLPLSGLFVQMLERLAVSTRPAQLSAADLDGTVWEPEEVLNAFGQLGDAAALPGLPGARLALGHPAADMPPGLYAGDDRRIALNVIGAETPLTASTWPQGTPVEGISIAEETQLTGALLTAALLVLVADLLASLAVSGKLGLRRTGHVAVLLLAAALIAPDARAQSPASPAEDAFALAATSDVILAHVLTGNAAVDRAAQEGLEGLSTMLFARTSVEPSTPMGVDLEQDELSFFPLLYWPVTADQPLPSSEAYAKLNRFLRSGGMVLFDTRDADLGGATSANGAKLQQLARPLDIPPLEQMPPDHVLTRTFYLLQDVPGRFNGRDLWVEAAPPDAELVEGMPFRNLNDGVTPVVIGGNDWASAWAMNDSGQPLYPVGRGYAGDRQRELAYRFGINLVMHVLTGNYKSDQVHVPALLDRLGQ